MVLLREHRPQTEPLTYLHIHNALELGYCHEGAGVYVVEDKIQPFEAGDVSVIDETEVHLARSAAATGSRWQFILLDPIPLFGAEIEAELPRAGLGLSGPRFCNIVSHRRHPAIADAMRTVLRELEAQAPGYRAVVRGRLLSLVAEVGRLMPAGNTPPSPKRASTLRRIAPALRQVAERYAEPLSVGSLARACGVSEVTLRRLFRAGVGKSPREYVTAVRLQMAASLLAATEQPVLDISLAVGYSSLSSFNRHFRRMMGMPPRAWRQRTVGQRGS
ncbi:MAG: helix-turn-helix transcriptional regulator [Kiritimatiellae bacterium]|nr:helix-turn-helix transcriptional regulator [Kiritimatiellia bacterium]